MCVIYVIHKQRLKDDMHCFLRTCWRTHQSVMQTVCPCRWHWPNWRPWQRSLTKKRGKLTNDVRSVTSQRPWTSATLTRFASESDGFIAQWAYSYRLNMDHQKLMRLSGHQFPLLCVHLQPLLYRNMFTSVWLSCVLHCWDFSTL